MIKKAPAPDIGWFFSLLIHKRPYSIGCRARWRLWEYRDSVLYTFFLFWISHAEHGELKEFGCRATDVILPGAEQSPVLWAHFDNDLA